MPGPRKESGGPMANLLGRAIVYVLNKSGALEIIQARAFADLRKRMRLLEKRNEDEFPDVQRRIRRLEQLLGDEPTQVASINFDHDRIEQHIQRKIGECQLELFSVASHRRGRHPTGRILRSAGWEHYAEPVKVLVLDLPENATERTCGAGHAPRSERPREGRRRRRSLVRPWPRNFVR